MNLNKLKEKEFLLKSIFEEIYLDPFYELKYSRIKVKNILNNYFQKIKLNFILKKENYIWKRKKNMYIMIKI